MLVYVYFDVIKFILVDVIVIVLVVKDDFLLILMKMLLFLKRFLLYFCLKFDFVCGVRVESIDL